MKLRWKILIATGIFLLLMAASLMVTLHVQPQNEVEAYKKLLREKGEKLEISDVLPAPVAPESNSVNAVEDAFRTFSSLTDVKIPNAMEKVAPGKALVGWKQPDARGWDFTNSWDEFGAEIEGYRPAVELLHQVLDRPKLVFQMDFDKSTVSYFSHLVLLKGSARALSATVICELHNGQTAEGVTNILTILALIHKNEANGLEISHLVRLGMASLALTPTWELLQTTNVTDAQLTAVQNAWHQLDVLSDAENAFAMERAWSLNQIEKLRMSHEAFRDTIISPMTSMGGSGGGSPDIWNEFKMGSRLAIGEALWRSSWSYSDELRELKADQIILDTLRSMQTNRSEFYKADYDSMASHFSTLGITNSEDTISKFLDITDFRDILGLGTTNSIRSTLRTEAGRRVVIVAIALKRFQLKHGSWPEALTELIPDYLPSMIVDPYDGKPLKYHPNTDGTFLLYCVGENGKDDGGDPTDPAAGNSALYWQSPKARDWVWPQPATPAEVQNYYEHPPK